jgi:outer membrane protein OmpA-like peptidoglycan-associated protein
MGGTESGSFFFFAARNYKTATNYETKKIYIFHTLKITLFSPNGRIRWQFFVLCSALKIDMLRLCIFLLLSFSAINLSAQSKKARKKLLEARTLVSEYQYKEALEEIDDAIEDSPEFVDAWLFKADILNQLSRAEEALQCYEEAQKLEAPYFLSLFQGRQLYNMQRYEESIPFLETYKAEPRASSKYIKEAEEIIASAKFAIEALKESIPYNPINLGPKVNSREMEYFPSISADGNTLVFTHRKLEGQKLDEDFWFTERDSVKAPWSQAQMIPGRLNSSGNEGAQSISSDGKIIFFAACERPDGAGSCDIYASFLQGDGLWTKAVNLGPAINSVMWESQPSISSDSKTLYFVRGRSGSDPDMNIYFSEYKGGRWSKAEPINGKINTNKQETSPYIHFDNEHLYFSSSGHPGMGDLDFFVSKREVDGSWGEPKNLGHPINTPFQEFSLIVAPDGRTGYFSSDALKDGLGKLDLYEFQLPPQAQASAIAYLKGKVINIETRAPVPSSLDFFNLEDSTKLLSRNTNKEAEFYAVLPVGSDYGLSIAQPGYLFFSRNFALSNQNREEALELLLELEPIKAGQSVTLENVFFDYDSYEISKRSDQEIEKVFQFLQLNPSLNVLLEGHTDNQGTLAHNKELSANRAKAVLNRLVKLGIDAQRLKSEGFGASKPIASNEDEKGRSKNRRTELRIISK